MACSQIRGKVHPQGARRHGAFKMRPAIRFRFLRERAAGGAEARGKLGAPAYRGQRRHAVDRRADLRAATASVAVAIPHRANHLGGLVCAGDGRILCGVPEGLRRGRQHSGVTRQSRHHRGYRDRRHSDCAILVPGHFGLACTRTPADVVGHDRGRGTAGRARPHGRAVGCLARANGTAPGRGDERCDLPRAWPGWRA